MPRYFLEVSYKGTNYSGFQIQPNAKTIQGEIEEAFRIYFHLSKDVHSFLTGSSRTDAGVHALQNFFHFDWQHEFPLDALYNLNAILPTDIAIRNIFKVNDQAHCRFDALSRTYHYSIYQAKNPFLEGVGYFYPYPLEMDLLQQAAKMIIAHTDFASFSKKNTQVKTTLCTIMESEWVQLNDRWVYKITGNRFLRGMVRALTATMLRVGRGKLSLDTFKDIIEEKKSNNAFFDTPAHGLMLKKVEFSTLFK